MESAKKIIYGLSAGFGIGIVLVGAFLLASLVLMLLVNVVLSHYGIKTLGFQESSAIVGLIMLFNSANKYNKDDK